MTGAQDIVLLGSLASLVAGMGTALGALGVFFVRRISARTEDAMLSLAAGIMLAATFFSLLLPAIEFGEAHYGGRVGAVAVVIAGVLAGGMALFAINRFVPHEHFHGGREGPEAALLRRIWLFAIAITIHNFPEGMAVGVAFAGGDIANGTSVAIGIGLQNVPEGMAVAFALLAARYGKARAFGIGALTGLVEPVGGLLGALAVSVAAPAMPLTLGFAAGAMLFIISHEIIPETHRRGYEVVATFALMIGFVSMMFLDATLG